MAEGSPRPSAAAPAPAPTATEIVMRPDPGIARGKWEAPAWAFWAMLGAILAFALAYLLRRMGMLSRTKKNEDPMVPPPSRGNRR